MKTLVLLVCVAFLSGCASREYSQYVTAQESANRLHVETQKPLVRIMAQPGMAITGLAGLEVYMPSTAPVIQQARPNEWVGVISQGIGVVGAVMGIKYAGDAAIGLANSVGKSSTAGYTSVQAPQTNVLTNTTTTTDTSNRSSMTTSSVIGANSGSNSGNSGRIAGTSIADATSRPTVVTQPAPVVVTQPE